MSSRTLRQCVLTAHKGSSRASVLTSTPRTSPSFSLVPASSPPPRGRKTYSPIQTRYFHPTPARRLFESSEAVVAVCLGVASGLLLTRFPLERLLAVFKLATFNFGPPISWFQAADEPTRQNVKEIVTAGFQMASKTPTSRREQAYREASFQVPHEIARLNPDAPRFRVEDMGSLSSLRKTWKEWEISGIKAPFNIEKDARVFLYFPNDSAKASAAFLAINADFTPPKHRLAERTDDQVRLLSVAMNIWLCQNTHWARRDPDILHRIGPERLPLIINFRGVACGAVWDSYSSRFLDPMHLDIMVPLILEDP